MLTILHGGDTRDLCSNFNIAMFLHFINGSCNGIIFSNSNRSLKNFKSLKHKITVFTLPDLLLRRLLKHLGGENSKLQEKKRKKKILGTLE